MIDPAILSRLHTIAGSNLEELAGAVAAAEIPLTKAVVNRLIAQRLAAASGPVTAVQVEALDNDTFSAHIHLRAKFIPTVRVVGRIEQQPELPHRPVVGIRWAIPAAGPLNALAGTALAFMKTLPRGLRADDDRILIDITELLRSQGLGGLVPFIAKASVHTRSGAFLLRFELKVA